MGEGLYGRARIPRRKASTHGRARRFAGAARRSKAIGGGPGTPATGFVGRKEVGAHRVARPASGTTARHRGPVIAGGGSIKGARPLRLVRGAGMGPGSGPLLGRLSGTATGQAMGLRGRVSSVSTGGPLAVLAVARGGAPISGPAGGASLRAVMGLAGPERPRGHYGVLRY